MIYFYSYLMMANLPVARPLTEPRPGKLRSFEQNAANVTDPHARAGAAAITVSITH